MKRLNLLVVGILMSSTVLFAGGLVTNTNQSAAYARTLSRNATLGIDAVYFNPAGLGFMDNGLHLSLSNQSIFQTRTITSNYPFLEGTPKSYEAELTAPIFPSIYAAYKMDKWAFSAGFNIIGGGGSADFATGLPTFEVPVSSLLPLMQNMLGVLDQELFDATGGTDFGYRNVTEYNMNAAFNGSSNYFGIQLGATYAINDLISVSIGGRYVIANNSYEGSLSDVVIDGQGPQAWAGGAVPPGDYLRAIVASNPLLPPDVQNDLNYFGGALDVLTGDKELKATQSGSGFTPIIGVNLHLSDMINIAAKYEHHTKIELTNDTEVDDVDMFPDGEKTRADLPGMFTLGAQVKPLKKLSASVGFDYFLDKSAYYGNMNGSGEQINNETTIDDNAYTLHGCLEYKFLGILGVSAGFSTGNLGVNDSYQSDLSYGLKSTSVGGGVFVDIGELLTINAGFTYVMYDDYSKDQAYQLPESPIVIDYADTYAKETMLFAIGVDIHL
jgi:long-subunit fatty acid transport protein